MESSNANLTPALVLSKIPTKRPSPFPTTSVNRNDDKDVLSLLGQSCAEQQNKKLLTLEDPDTLSTITVEKLSVDYEYDIRLTKKSTGTLLVDGIAEFVIAGLADLSYTLTDKLCLSTGVGLLCVS